LCSPLPERVIVHLRPPVAQDVGDKRRESYGRRQLVDRRRDQDRSQDGCTCSNEHGRIHDLQVRANWR